MEVNPVRLKMLLRNLLDCYSPSGKEEEILEFAASYLEQHGLVVVRQAVDEHRFNLLVFPENPDRITLCYVGHLDTVTAYDLNSFGFREQDSRVYGVGAADMKAGCAAMMEVFTALAENNALRDNVGLALVVDEEEDNSGAKTLVAEYNFPWAVIGEPTGLVPCLGHYGYLELLLRTRGKRAHPAVPEQGLNAITGMLRLLMSLTEFATSHPGGVVYNIRDLSAYPLGFVIPDSCEVWLDLHSPPDYLIDVLKSELERVVSDCIAGTHRLDAEMRFEEAHAGYKISPDRPVVRTLRQVFADMSLTWQPSDFRSHSDANTLWGAGVDPIILGPGRLEEAHTPEEFVAFPQVVAAAGIYLNLALSLSSS